MRGTVANACKKLNVTKILDEKMKLRKQFNLYHHLIVNEEHKVLYCFVPKVGCTEIKKIFLVMDGMLSSIKEIILHDNLHELNLTRLDNKTFSKRQQEHMIKNFYKFLIVRDPFERLVSAFRDKMQNQRNNHPYYRKVARDIVKKYRYNNKRHVANGYDVTFKEYVRYLLDERPEEFDEHWMRYEDLCRPCDIKYDFIGSIGSIVRDVAHVMRQIHANETKYYVPPSSKARAKTKQTIANFLQKLPRQHFNQLVAIYKTDHELFGYPLPDYGKLYERYPAT